LRRRVLVTGAGGFVGLHLARAFRADGGEVHAVVRPGGSRWRLGALAAEAEVHEADLVERAAVETLVARVRPELVVHAAARSAYAPRDLAAALAGSATATANLLGALRGTGARFLLAGSATVYGPGAALRRECDPLRPSTLRGTEKACAALLLAEAARGDGIDAGELRLFAVYGPWEAPDRLVPSAVRAALDGAPLPLTGAGVARDFVFAGDVAGAFLAAARLGEPLAGRVWNVGSGVATTNEEVVAAIEAAVGRPIARRPGAHPGGANDLGLLADPARAARELSWRATTPLASGLAATAAFWRERSAGAAEPEAAP
jgi:nucleoside-diphosphate-sugar epimerase